MKEKKHGIIYALELVFWGLLSIYWYRSILFRVVPGMSLAQSKLLFFGLWVIASVLGYLLTPPGKRNTLAVFATINTPLTVFFLISYQKIYPKVVWAIVILLLVFVLLYILLVAITCSRDILAGKYRGKLGRFFLHFVHRIRMITGVILSTVLIGAFAVLMFGEALLSPTVEPNDPRYKEQKIANNIDTVLLLQEDLWEELSIQERLDVLQTVANIEATYLGLPHELNVFAETLDETVLGSYSDRDHKIKISVDYLMTESAQVMLETLAHEAYHAYQHRLVDLYDQADPEARDLLLFTRIREYKADMEDYIDAEDDLLGYLFQTLELDSDLYAADAVEDYYDAIAEHLNPED